MPALLYLHGGAGGILKSEQSLPFKREMYELSLTYRRFCEQAGVEIRLNTEVNSEYVETEAPDAPYVAVIGDAARVSTITNAVYQGYHAALDI